MRVGTFCYATSRGLGHLAKAFYDNYIITDPLVVRHSRVPTNERWYPEAPSTDHRSLDIELLKKHCHNVEAMLFFETPYWWDIIPYCASIGVRTYLVTMYECTPERHHLPHCYICPSDLDMDYFVPRAREANSNGIQARCERLNLPVEVPWNLRKEAKVFVHNGGYLGLRGREGTRELIEAIQYVKSPIKLIIRVQENVEHRYLDMIAKDKRIDYRPATVPYSELFKEGDVYIAPQKFNGCSLPLQEAFAAGMLVMTTDRYPMNTWLPGAPLIPVDHENKGVSIGGPYLKFDESIVTPQIIATSIDNWYGLGIEDLSDHGRIWAKDNSWQTLGPKWLEVLSK